MGTRTKQFEVDEGLGVPSTSVENNSFSLEEPQALLDSIQADAILEPQNGGIENICTLTAAVYQDFRSKESIDPAMEQLVIKNLHELKRTGKANSR